MNYGGLGQWIWVAGIVADDEFDINAFSKELQTWSKHSPPEARSAFTSTYAARNLPEIGGYKRPKRYPGFSFDLRLLRAIFTTAVATAVTTVGVKNAADSAARSVHRPAIFANVSNRSSEPDAAVISAHSATLSVITNASVSLSPSARSADLLARSARSATKLLNQSAPKALFDAPLWLDVTWPDEIADNWTTLRGEWSTDPAMAFWIDWYEGLLVGRAPDWDLWHDIVLINDEHWDAGPEVVAREIERIKSELRDKRAEKFEDHVRSMVPRFKVLAPQADRLANLIEEALNLYHREVSNCTADSIEPLEKLPNILRQIRFQLMSDTPEDKRVKELALLVHAMVDTIDQLNRRLERANALPLDQRSPSPSRVTKVITHPLFNTVLGAVLAAGLTTFAGAAGDDVNKEFIDQTEGGLCLTDFPKEPAPEQTPAETSDIPPEAFTRV